MLQKKHVSRMIRIMQIKAETSDKNLHFSTPIIPTLEFGPILSGETNAWPISSVKYGLGRISLVLDVLEEVESAEKIRSNLVTK